MSSSTIAPVARPALETPDLPLLNAVLEGFVDGIVVLAEDGTCIHSNQRGTALCRDLNSDRPGPEGPGQPLVLPPCLKTMYRHLVESRDLYPETILVLTQEFTSRSGQQIRARIQWLDLPGSPGPFLLISLENKTRAAQSSALLEAIQYNLTPREQAVWMLRRANRTYEEIAKELYITVNTVKRHLKSIYAKRKEVTEAMAN
jgi:RNA polymerase sigma factor (sigma-70 family)